MNDIIEKYIDLIKKSEKLFLNQNDIDSKEYNKLAKKLYYLQELIIKSNNYMEIYKEILKNTND